VKRKDELRPACVWVQGHYSDYRILGASIAPRARLVLSKRASNEDNVEVDDCSL